MDCFCSINCALGIAFICRAGKHFCRHQVNAFRSKRSRLKSINHPERSLTLGLLCTLRSVILHRHRFIYFFPLFESTQFCDSFQVFDADRMISFFFVSSFHSSPSGYWFDRFNYVHFFSRAIQVFRQGYIYLIWFHHPANIGQSMIRNERFKLNRIMTIFLILEKSKREKENLFIISFLSFLIRIFWNGARWTKFIF